MRNYDTPNPPFAKTTKIGRRYTERQKLTGRTKPFELLYKAPTLPKHPRNGA